MSNLLIYILSLYSASIPCSTPLNLIIQYCIVGGILAAAVVWVIWKAVKRRKSGEPPSCCGCALSDACSRKDREKKKKKGEC